MASFDININATLELEDADWEALVADFDGDEDDALYELTSDLESSNLDSMYGSAWVCSADGSQM